MNNLHNLFSFGGLQVELECAKQISCDIIINVYNLITVFCRQVDEPAGQFNREGISKRAEQLLAIQEGRCCMEVPSTVQ